MELPIEGNELCTRPYVHSRFRDKSGR